MENSFLIVFNPRLKILRSFIWYSFWPWFWLWILILFFPKIITLLIFPLPSFSLGLESSQIQLFPLTTYLYKIFWLFFNFNSVLNVSLFILFKLISGFHPLELSAKETLLAQLHLNSNLVIISSGSFSFTSFFGGTRRCSSPLNKLINCSS